MAQRDDPSPVESRAARPERLIDHARTLLGFDTQNPPGGTRAAVDWLEATVDDLGLETERFAVDPAKPNLLATLPGDGDAVLGFNGHLDTVPFDADQWTHDPLGEREGDRLYGRGAADMKGAVASMLAAAEAFVSTDTTPPVTLVFAFVADEETGGDAGVAALVQADRFQVDACVIGEPTGPRERPSVVVADRGSIWLTVEAVGEAAHGSRPMFGENAIDRLYEGIETIRERFGSRELAVDAAVEPIVEESVAYYTRELGEEGAGALFRRPTINLGTLEGGETINTVPSTARAEVDVRLSPGVDTREVLAALRECAADCEGVSIADVSWSVGTYESIDSPLVEAVADRAETVLGDRVYRRSATGGGDAKKLRRAGVPTVEFALATDTAHAVEEYTTVDLLADNARIYAALPYAYADRSG